MADSIIFVDKIKWENKGTVRGRFDLIINIRPELNTAENPDAGRVIIHGCTLFVGNNGKTFASAPSFKLEGSTRHIRMGWLGTEVQKGIIAALQAKAKEDNIDLSAPGVTRETSATPVTF